MLLNSHSRLGTHRVVSAEILGSSRVTANPEVIPLCPQSRDFGKFALDRPAMSVHTAIPVFNELGDATCLISQLFVQMESPTGNQYTMASIGTNPPNMLQIALDEY